MRFFGVYSYKGNPEPAALFKYKEDAVKYLESWDNPHMEIVVGDWKTTWFFKFMRWLECRVLVWKGELTEY